MLRPYKPIKPYPLLLWILIILPLAACYNTPPTAQQDEVNTLEQAVIENIEQANRLAATKSQLLIENYIQRHQLDTLMQAGQGYYYAIWGTPHGTPPREGQTVRCAYTLSLLNGTLAETIPIQDPITLVLGRRDYPTGLELLLQQMYPGQQAYALLPAHLGYGIQGKQPHIPPHECLIYRITFFQVIP